MTRFPRRATIIAAVLLAAPLGFSLSTAAAAVAAPAVHAAGVVAQSVADEDLTARVAKAKKKKKVTKKKAGKKKVVTPAKKVTPKPVESTSLEAAVVTLSNNFRTANGCGAMHIDGRLTAAARAHSTDMVTHNFFDHTGSAGTTFVQREASAGYPSAGASAENIAYGYATAQEVVDGWINSPGHRANLLNCASVAVGVGLAYKADGTPYWTQDFGRV